MRGGDYGGISELRIEVRWRQRRGRGRRSSANGAGGRGTRTRDGITRTRDELWRDEWSCPGRRSLHRGRTRQRRRIRSLRILSLDRPSSSDRSACRLPCKAHIRACLGCRPRLATSNHVSPSPAAPCISPPALTRSSGGKRAADICRSVRASRSNFASLEVALCIQPDMGKLGVTPINPRTRVLPRAFKAG